ncbi:MAG: helix-turn-helix domain-containing protein [Rhodoferax sp.]
MKHTLHTSEQIGLLLQSARKHRGFTQAALARCMGISQSRLSKMEQDPQSLSVGQLLALCAQLGLELSMRDKDSAELTVTPAAGTAVPPTSVEW